MIAELVHYCRICGRIPVGQAGAVCLFCRFPMGKIETVQEVDAYNPGVEPEEQFDAFGRPE